MKTIFDLPHPLPSLEKQLIFSMFFWFSNIWLLHNMIFQLPILYANKHHYVFRRCMNQYIIMFQSLNRPAYRFYLKLNIKQRLLIFILLSIGFWLSQISIVPILTLLLAPPATALITPYGQHLWGNNIYWTVIGGLKILELIFSKLT